ncbi:MAG: beta-ketoacyl synthase N-terminal-like domain-containing protein [Ilumatobacter sp.]|uniref:beta-ketoacyl synthase N-terminal-like domain-containing protein n=1 Tax=Ilumatobacter sp. TaxID=1967498 RepID=UPI003298FCDA
MLRAGVSAFGFGGNNAHLVLEEPGTAATLVARVDSDPDTDAPAASTTPIAIVGLGVTAASAVGRHAFTEALLAGTSCLDADGNGSMPDVELPLAGLKFPPNDLRAALGQQLAILRVTDEALADCGPIPADRTGVYVGMGTDPDAARFGVRWRITRLAEQLGESVEWIDAALDAVGPALDSAGVLGTMPNLVANRVNSQYDISGPSFTVSSEERSGVDALELAVRALRTGDLDVALVGAADLSCNAVHLAAREMLDVDSTAAPGDAAVMLILKRLDDAVSDGDTIHALVTTGPTADGGEHQEPRPRGDLHLVAGCDDSEITKLFGHAHTASGLLHVAAAAVSLRHRVAPGGDPILASNPASGSTLPSGAGPRTATVDVVAMTEAPGVWQGSDPLHTRCSVSLAEATDHPAPSRIPAPRLHVFAGADSAAVLADLAAGVESTDGAARLVIVADDEAQFESRAERARLHIAAGKPAGTGVHFRSEPLVGEMAFVFTAGGAAYNGMGRQLLAALPEITTPNSTQFPLRDVAGWVFDPEHAPNPTDFLWGTALISQAHVQVSRGILGLRPQASIGYSSGETNSLFAFGAWTDMDAMRAEIEASGMLEQEIGVEFTAVARAWGVESADWSLWNVLAPLDEVRAAIADEERVHLTIINTARDVVIGGDSTACDRVVDAIGRQRCRPVDYNLACHVPEVAAAFHQQWVDVHTRAVTPVDGVRFYSNGAGGAYEIGRERCAEVITRQAENTVDFPTTIRAAHADGVRIFVEHGPSGACTNFIRQILDGHDIVAVHLDRRDHDIEQVFEVAAALVAAGVDVDHSALTARLDRRDPVPPASDGPTLSFPAHSAWMPLTRTESEAESLVGASTSAATPRPTFQQMPPAPALPSVFMDAVERPPTPFTASNSTARRATSDPSPSTDPQRTPADPPPATAPLPPRSRHDHAEAPPAGSSPADDSPATQAAAIVQSQMASVAALHQRFLDQQSTVHQHFLAQRAVALGALADIPHTSDAVASPASPPRTPEPAPSAPVDPLPVNPLPVDALDADGPHRPEVVPTSGRATPTGPTWDKRELEIHSSGRISELFGPMFEPQDQYTIQCRMPEPPLLLADRVTGLVAEAGVLGTGTIWTETDVVADAWFLHDGYMPAGFMIEAGQADLMLISYMGIDLVTRGERSYRLLGCTLTYHGDLPSPGETLEYEIRITGHARHGDIRLFFFEYDCTVDGEPRLTVRDAQAGFFTAAELDDALGLVWTPEAGRRALEPDARVDPPVVVCTKTSFDRSDVVAFSEGRTLECFGPGFEWAETHTRSPRIQAGDQLFIDEVTEFDPTGGPWGRGFMRCESDVADDAWFFDGHFKNDPCMPGNFMVEACIEAMSIYLAALGHTLRADGWRFQPLPDQPFELKCRGEINPQTSRVAYELHVEEIHSGPHPTIICDVVGFVDGAAAFHAHRIGVELVPGWPLSTMPELYAGFEEPVAVATGPDGLPFDRKAILSTAWGKPSDAFGTMYEVFDGTRRSPRLPGEPYLFISRITEIVGDLDVCEAGMEIVCEYDIPHDAWYFDENGAETMPYAVLLEAALQPCGWVASAVGSASAMPTDVLFRNLDGTGTLVGELTRTAGTLTTRVKLTSVSQAGGMVIEGFDVECSLGDRVVYTMTTVFGFFPPAAFEDQAGLPIAESDRASIDLVGGDTIDLTGRTGAAFAGTARLAGDQLLMIDRVTRIPGAGRNGLGVVRGEKDVDVSEWFFKAHFFQDPVQPGSLGVEALLQLLQFHMIDSGMADGIEDARFEPILLDAPMTWKYRGQVTPLNTLITSTMEITETGVDESGPFVVGSGSLWCDGLRIYEVSNMGMRIVSGAPGADSTPAPDEPTTRSGLPSPVGSASTTETTDASPTISVVTVTRASHPQLADHAVDGTPVVPVAFAVEWFARAAAEHRPDLRLVELSDVRVLKGLLLDDYFDDGSLEVEITARTTDSSPTSTTLALDLVDAGTKRPHYRCTALLTTDAPARPVVDGPGDVTGGEAWSGVVYDGEVLFHGSAFQVIRSVDHVSPGGLSAALVGVGGLAWPPAAWTSDPALLDGGLQLALRWTHHLLGARSLPTGIERIRHLDPPAHGRHVAVLTGRRSTPNMVVCDVAITGPDGRLTTVLEGIQTHVIGAV